MLETVPRSDGLETSVEINACCDLLCMGSFGSQLRPKAVDMIHFSHFLLSANLRPYLHGSFLPLKDCTLHVVGLRQTMQLEGLTRGFDLTAEDNLAKASVAKTSGWQLGDIPQVPLAMGIMA